MSIKADGTPDARFTHLVKRALFELRLAVDIARADDYEPQVRALLEGARGNLRRCLSWVESPAVSNQQSGDE